MRYRTFGKTGWQVSEIAFGGWQLGGQWGNVDDRESIATLHYAFEKGINFVDTAESYGNGRSEDVVGQALKAWHGGKIYVATKAAPVRWPPPSEDRPDMRGRYPDWYLREHVENSLKRLGVERLDLFQLHCWIARGTTDLDWLGTLNDLRLEGKIDRIGVSIRDNRPEDGVGLAKLGLVDSHQVVFNMFDQRPAGELFKAGAKTNTAFIARVPLDSGSLVGNWTEDTNKGWEPDAVPAWLFRGERFPETLRRVNALKALCSPYYRSLAEAAMRYVLSAPELSTLIPGMKNKTEVDMNIAYSDGKEFPAELLEALPEHIWARNFYQ
ncbi:aldo/keto reductase [Agrobacterium rhizogenes]|uniref:aldo/keto reductase n=1 Tax=Rhizobium rhizogenes TaxID=359 RepID=UPI0015746CAC|nr:aldo/keto reductase [Rhizobium rhizogenes]NTH16613.1 aldo/keto reductase [Rhizobium rhizogenes]